MNVKIQWATSNIDSEIMYMARVSNPKNQDSSNIKLLYYCMNEGHVSPFEMANVCLQIDTTRDIARQILRHRSFSFQEFSQRYANVTELEEAQPRAARLQDHKNRQNSLPTDDADIVDAWNTAQQHVIDATRTAYKYAISLGIAKEQARSLLPEGYTSTRLYMNGNMRSWIFYLKQRLHESTQQEHRVIAQAVLDALRTVAPITMDAFFGGH